jgi:murein DD-endopeptidase MepM/ murein hydrolase activator NlpD
VLLLLACAPEPVSRAAAPVEDLTPRGELQFRFPLEERELFELVVGVDHDPADYSDGSVGQRALCTTYDGRAFPYCYDGHHGSDFILDGGFATMDAGSATILAAAPGVVVETADGNYDRCHAEGDGIDCDGNPGDANYVIVEHEGGWTTRYWHMMSGSVAVAVGDEVACGDVLGKVGSSGYSSQPHLHFELESPEGEVVDPYAGPYSQPETWWVVQGTNAELPASTCAGG